MANLTEQINALVDETMQRPRLPRATYRLQFNPDFTFQDALALVDYLDDLGISDLYASPLFKPRAGSMHGYDIVDYKSFNPALGTAEEFDTLSSTLRGSNMGLLLDIVPNHMGINSDNEWWMDVLKHGPSSVYAHYFDIEWFPQNRLIDNKVVLPVLGDYYGLVLEAGELRLVYWHGDFYIHYYDHQFPITPETYTIILQRVHEHLLAGEAYEDWTEMELSSVIMSLEHMPLYTTTDAAALEVRRREQVIIRWRLLGLFDKSMAFRSALENALETLNGDPGEPASFDDLDDLLNRQPYRLSYWRVATDEINYRRFFDINDMGAIRIEDPQVFADTHWLALQLLAEGKISGLRIDHPDGLWEPEAYFRRLQEAYVATCVRHRLKDTKNDLRIPAEDRLKLLHYAHTHDPAHAPEWPLYVLIEKILSETEPLPSSWAVYGTTGYDFIYVTNNLFVDASNETAFDTLYTDFAGEMPPFEELTDYTKKLVMSQSLTSEIEARSAELARIVEQNRRYRGLTQNSLAFGMSEFIAALSVYRTYITGRGPITDRDRYYIERAIRMARQRNPLTPSGIFDFLRDALLMENWLDFSERWRDELREFIMKFQQITGPVMAKSVEDTAFYIYNRLTSLNEVGGHPERFGMSPEDFHAHNRRKVFPHTMLSSSTHDTKRSEDVRARINVLSEMPDEWTQKIREWSEINAGAKTEVNEQAAPSANDEYLLYQTLIGAYEDNADDLDTFRTRIITYMGKAINEAKTNSNWINPNEEYAQAVADFVTQALDDKTFRASFQPFQRRVAFFGRFNSLSQTLLKLTAPGIPDIYQGTELWDYSLVDPDNRRPVDFEQRRTLLAELKQAQESDRPTLLQKLIEEAPTGLIKLYLIYCTLNYRRANEILFRDGDYIPVEVNGGKANHACAYLRQFDGVSALVVVPRLVVGLTAGEMLPPTGSAVWADAHLILPEMFEGKDFTNVLTGKPISASIQGDRLTLPLADLLADFPVGLLAGTQA